MREPARNLQLVRRVDQLEKSTVAVAATLSRIEDRLGEVQAAPEVQARLERVNRNWMVVFFAGALAFAVYVTLVNTPMGLRFAESGLPPTIAEPGTPAPSEFGVSTVRVIDGVGLARVTYSNPRPGVPVVVATPTAGSQAGVVAAAILTSSNAGFEVRVASPNGLAESDALEVHWVAY